MMLGLEIGFLMS